ncbi:MAG: hypothetical protein J0I19_15935 [Alphaproteobacteria bacterium]|nr:hypothetical protein [Alphaproteobacteria bacterium]
MCEPVSMGTLLAVSLGMSAATGVTSFLGQQQQEIANRHNAENSFRIANQQTNLGIQQQEAADSQQAQQSQREAITAASTARASAGETGTAGASVDNLVNDYHATEGRFFNDLATQGAWNRAQADVQKQGQVATAQRQILSVPKPNILGAALRIGAGALDGYNNTYGRLAKP